MSNSTDGNLFSREFYSELELELLSRFAAKPDARGSAEQISRDYLADRNPAEIDAAAARLSALGLIGSIGPDGLTIFYSLNPDLAAAILEAIRGQH